MFEIWVAFICTLTFASLWPVISAIGTGKDVFTFTFTTGWIKILIVTTAVNSSALTLTNVIVKIVFGRTFFVTTTFTDAILIQNLVWWTLCVGRAFTFAVVKILNLWFFAKFKPAITVTDCLVEKFWKVACLLTWTHTFTYFWFKDSGELTRFFRNGAFTSTFFFIQYSFWRTPHFAFS